ncbi:MAG: potassium transporter Kup [Hyphomicrobium sp.]|nr:potassium transporter Kup [Hyphomicrobium sp.]PPC84293.1 MAG: potassium transporter Kup [Hyphomicrobium sp.]
MARTEIAGRRNDASAPDETHSNSFWALTLGSVGVVYGDIGTSPLYAFREAVAAAHNHGISNRDIVLGVLSLILWVLVLIVTLKYVWILLRADNKGEGGTFALMALAQKAAPQSAPLLMTLAVSGAAFFYGDAVITPAISVISAVEGLKLVHPGFAKAVLPISIVIILGLFWMQSRGTEKVARLFGPITVVWFLAMGLGGLAQMIKEPSVLAAFNPVYGIAFAASNGLIGLTVLGLVFLAVTGAEALYADLGHFGRKPIQAAWFGLVFPALAFNYLGQGALVLAEPTAIENPFFGLYPEWALIPMVLLATMATVIASQAVITGAFSLTRQAIQLGLLPRLAITHTSESMSGQIYMPGINWLLLIGVLILVLVFKTSSNLASAYGVAVTADMIITSVIAFFVVWKVWGWSLWKAAAIMLPLLLIEQIFFIANMLKVLEGGWVPLMLAMFLATIMFTWVRGTKQLSKNSRTMEADLPWLLRKLEAKPPTRVPGTAIFLTGDPDAAPVALMHNLKHNRVIHERNIILSIRTEDTPRVPRHERIVIDRPSDTFIRVIARYGFMETPSIPKIFEHCKRKDLNIDMGGTSFFLSRRSIRPTLNSELYHFERQLFMGLARSAQDATTYFKIPTDRVVEVGTQVSI